MYSRKVSVIVELMVYRIKNEKPRIHPSVFIAENAVVAGQVSLAEGCSVWFSATLRGDIAPIVIGKNTNIQDGSVVHCDTDVPTTVGEGVTVGHGAILHSCNIEDNTLIGMGAIILSGARIGRDSIVAAGALVPGNREFPPRSLILGSPAKVQRQLTDAEVDANAKNAQHYIDRGAEAKIDYQDADTK